LSAQTVPAILNVYNNSPYIMKEDTTTTALDDWILEPKPGFSATGTEYRGGKKNKKTRKNKKNKKTKKLKKNKKDKKTKKK
jgi:hypothetical protein